MTEKYTTEQQVNHINQLAQGVSLELGADWQVKPRDPERDLPSDARRELLGPAGEFLGLSFNTYPKPYIHISGRFPRYTDGQYVSYSHSEVKDEVTSINVSVEKSPTAVAKDIRRRLLPGYGKVLDYVLHRIAEQSAYTSARDENGLKLMTILGTPERFKVDHDSYTSYDAHDPSVDVQPSSKSANLTIRSCPIGLAEAICQTIADYRQNRRGQK